MAGLTLLSQVALLSPNAVPTGRTGGAAAAAAAGLGGAAGGAALAGLTGMYSNVGGAVNQLSYCGRRRRSPNAGGRPGRGGVGGSRSPFAPADPSRPKRPSPWPAGASDGRSPSGSPTRSGACTAATASGGDGSAFPRPRRRTARLRGEHGCGERRRPRGPVRRDWLLTVRTAGPAAHPSTGPTAATATTIGASSRPSCGVSRQRSGAAGCGAAAARAGSPSGWRPAGPAPPVRPASSLSRRSTGSDGLTAQQQQQFTPPTSPSAPPVALQAESTEPALQLGTTTYAARGGVSAGGGGAGVAVQYRPAQGGGTQGNAGGSAPAGADLQSSIPPDRARRRGHRPSASSFRQWR